MLAVEILGILLLGYCLARAELSLRKSLRDIDRMPLPNKPFDGETDRVWADIERHHSERQAAT